MQNCFWLWKWYLQYSMLDNYPAVKHRKWTETRVIHVFHAKRSLELFLVLGKSACIRKCQNNRAMPANSIKLNIEKWTITEYDIHRPLPVRGTIRKRRNNRAQPSKILIWPGLKVIKLEYSLRLKIKRNDWLLADTCPQAANHCALYWVWEWTQVF